jgi:hypothetical protein
MHHFGAVGGLRVRFVHLLQDDPRGLMKWIALATAAATPFFVYIVGLPIVHGFNAAGIVLRFG